MPANTNTYILHNLISQPVILDLSIIISFVNGTSFYNILIILVEGVRLKTLLSLLPKKSIPTTDIAPRILLYKKHFSDFTTPWGLPTL